MVVATFLAEKGAARVHPGLHGDSAVALALV